MAITEPAVDHADLATLEAGLTEVLQSPREAGRVELIVVRTEVEARKVVDQATLDADEGVVGDNWRARGNSHTPDGEADPEAQVTVMNARFATLVAGSPDRRPIAGDQLYIDLDLSRENLPPGTLLEVGDAVLEVSSKPHTGCAKFLARFGKEALAFANSDRGRALSLRGINTKVVRSGVVRTGDTVRKVPPSA